MKLLDERKMLYIDVGNVKSKLVELLVVLAGAHVLRFRVHSFA